MTYTLASSANTMTSGVALLISSQLLITGDRLSHEYC